MVQKKLISEKPRYTDTGQYNFADSDNAPFDYNDSTSLPKNNDKFVKKDLYTLTDGNELNNAIIERNLQFEGGNFIRIDTLYIKNSGHDHTLRGINVKGYMFSQKTYDVGGLSYDNIALPATTQFFGYEPSNVAEGNDLGNLSFLEGENIITNFYGTSTPMQGNGTAGDNDTGLFPHYKTTYNIQDSFKKVAAADGDLTSIFDSIETNPIYIVIWIKAEADRSWGSDKCRRIYNIFKFDNIYDCFNVDDQGNLSGTAKVLSELSNEQTQGNGGSGAAEAARFHVSELSVTINTSPGGVNDFSTGGSGNADEADYEEYFGEVQPSIQFEPNEIIPSTFFQIGPDRQLFNSDSAGYDKSGTFPDYFTRTTVGTTGVDGEMNNNYIDLQSYYEDDAILSLQASAPSTITFNLTMINPTDAEMATPVNGIYFYFVVNWDDVDNKIKTLNDFTKNRPVNNIELLDLKDEGLYIIGKQSQNGTNTVIDTLPLKYTYNTPGIKNLKIVIFSYDEENKSAVRWKLVTCRFFLDIPINQFPDFGVLGGDDYTTIPWPHTTPIIGGVDVNSKYKKSIQNILSSGNVSDTDIIDERLLISDIENDEMGKSIDFMDLEQIRFFDTPNDLNKLLNIPIEPTSGYYVAPYTDTNYWSAETPETTFSEESSVGQIFIGDNLDLDLKKSCQLEFNTGNLSGKSIYDSSGKSNKGLLIGNYKVKKQRKGEPMKRDSFIKVSKKDTKDGAL